MRYSPTEIREILIAVGAMTLAFAMAIVGGVQGFPLLVQDLGVTGLLVVFASAFIAVVTAFLLHELGHKAVAQRYGCFAEFRYYPMGLALGVITGALGFLFAMPGAVVISGPVGPRENLRISAAGPGTNIALGTIFLGVAGTIGASPGSFADLTRTLVGSAAFVNVFLGFFNLIPLPPLDGSKIFVTNKIVWALLIAAVGATFAAGRLLNVF